MQWPMPMLEIALLVSQIKDSSAVALSTFVFQLAVADAKNGAFRSIRFTLTGVMSQQGAGIYSILGHALASGQTFRCGILILLSLFFF